jgi:alcohol dehydrogenase
MLNGTYYNPTIFHFGKGMEAKLGEEVAKHSKRVLLLYGGESLKKFGTFDQIVAMLGSAGIEAVELGGVQPNPRAGLVYRGIELCRKENIDFIVAAGGGSVIDSAKAISIGVPSREDFADIFRGTVVPQNALKIAAVLTVPGSGSESNSGAVITFEDKKEKLAFGHPLLFPVVSIMNPEFTLTLPPFQTACGIVDALSHILERYFTTTTYVDCTDRIGESLMATLMKYAALVKESPGNYEIRAEIMWACKLAHDNTTGFGRKQDWATHAIAHEIGARYDVVHGAAVGVLFPAWMTCVYKTNMDRFHQFAQRVFGLDDPATDRERAVLLAIEKFKDFLRSIGMPVSLPDLGIHTPERFAEIARASVRFMASGTIGNFARLGPPDIEKILDIALRA